MEVPGDPPERSRDIPDSSAVLRVTSSRAMSPAPADDRRGAKRIPNPTACPECRHRVVRAVVRTMMVVYYRCEDCGHVWNIPVPPP